MFRLHVVKVSKLKDGTKRAATTRLVNMSFHRDGKGRLQTAFHTPFFAEMRSRVESSFREDAGTGPERMFPAKIILTSLRARKGEGQERAQGLRGALFLRLGPSLFLDSYLLAFSPLALPLFPFGGTHGDAPLPSTRYSCQGVIRVVAAAKRGGAEFLDAAVLDGEVTTYVCPKTQKTFYVFPTIKSGRREEVSRAAEVRRSREVTGDTFKDRVRVRSAATSV